jgi:flagellar basal body-associated protein FliL
MGVFMPENTDRKRFLAIMFGVTGIVLLMVSFVLPWWGLHTEIEEKSTTGAEVYYVEGGFGISISSGISYGNSGTSFYIGDFSTPKVYTAAAILMILALIFATLMTVTIILNWLRKNMKSKLPIMLGVLAIMFCLLAPLIFMAALPGAMKADEEKEAKDNVIPYNEPDHDDPTKSFFGSYEDKDNDSSSIDITRTNWGGDIGWTLSFVSFALLLISVIMVIPRKPAPPRSRRPPDWEYESEFEPEPEPKPTQSERYDRRPPPRRRSDEHPQPHRERYDPRPPPHQDRYERPPPPDDNYEYDYPPRRRQRRSEY